MIRKHFILSLLSIATFGLVRKPKIPWEHITITYDTACFENGCFCEFGLFAGDIDNVKFVPRGLNQEERDRIYYQESFYRRITNGQNR